MLRDCVLSAKYFPYMSLTGDRIYICMNSGGDNWGFEVRFLAQPPNSQQAQAKVHNDSRVVSISPTAAPLKVYCIGANA